MRTIAAKMKAKLTMANLISFFKDDEPEIDHSKPADYDGEYGSE